MIRKERRRAKRISTNLTVSWHSSDQSGESKVTDLSTEGCFILTADQMSANKLSRVTDVPERNSIRVELTLPSDESLKLDGEVVFRIERLGFGVRFLNVNAPHKQALGAFIDKQGGGTLGSLAFPRVRGHKQ